jgi:hypothetical protein
MVETHVGTGEMSHNDRTVQVKLVSGQRSLAHTKNCSLAHTNKTPLAHTNKYSFGIRHFTEARRVLVTEVPTCTDCEPSAIGVVAERVESDRYCGADHACMFVCSLAGFTAASTWSCLRKERAFLYNASHHPKTA